MEQVRHCLTAHLLAVLSLSLSCCTPTREAQLQNVAKDWSLTIRASQVIPVYPMTEDLQPGDVFLVQRTVEDQHASYTERGFLPFENHLARLPLSDYADFYSHSFFKPDETNEIMPRFWLKPGEQASFDRAPGAAFPAYTFAVSSSAGFSGALPIQGVPVGLSLLNTGTATGSVTIKDARTYGLSIMTLLPDVQKWAEGPDARQTLALYAPASREAGSAPTNYIRVVSRVYMTGKIAVTLTDTQASSGGLSVGVPKPVELPLLAPPTAANGAEVKTANADSYKAGLDSLSTALSAPVKDAEGKMLPGATLKITASSARSVSIDETMTRPVVIGYLGFDMAILPGGTLGPPCPTHAVLERTQHPASDLAMPGFVAALTMRDIGAYRALSALATSASDPDKQRAAELQGKIDAAAKELLPLKYPVSIWSVTPQGELKDQVKSGEDLAVAASPYRTLLTYVGQLEDSEKVLSKASTREGFAAAQRADLTKTQSELSQIRVASYSIRALLRDANTLLDK